MQSCYVRRRHLIRRHHVGCFVVGLLLGRRRIVPTSRLLRWRIRRSEGYWVVQRPSRRSHPAAVQTEVAGSAAVAGLAQRCPAPRIEWSDLVSVYTLGSERHPRRQCTLECLIRAICATPPEEDGELRAVVRWHHDCMEWSPPTVRRSRRICGRRGT